MSKSDKLFILAVLIYAGYFVLQEITGCKADDGLMSFHGRCDIRSLDIAQLLRYYAIACMIAIPLILVYPFIMVYKFIKYVANKCLKT